MRPEFLSFSKWKCLIIFSIVLTGLSAHADTLTVAGTSDIYAAGHSTLPVTTFPGTFPPFDTFAAGPNQILTFSSVTGLVGCNFRITNGPDGTCFPGVDTTVIGEGGLSGISVSHANMFLVGVFLDPTEPTGLGPITLSYNFGTPGGLNTTDPSFSPTLDQVFFVGDGLTETGSGSQQVFFVPMDATRLYLGFADSFDGLPSFYDDDVGALTATFSIGSATTPEPASIGLLGFGLILLGYLWRRRLGAGSPSR